MIKIQKIDHIIKYKVKLNFSDGFNSVVDLESLLGKELLEPEKFDSFYIEPGGGLAWPNGFDICPNHLREIAESRQLHLKTS